MVFVDAIHHWNDCITVMSNELICSLNKTFTILMAGDILKMGTMMADLENHVWGGGMLIWAMAFFTVLRQPVSTRRTESHGLFRNALVGPYRCYRSLRLISWWLRFWQWLLRWQLTSRSKTSSFLYKGNSDHQYLDHTVKWWDSS